MLPEFSIPDLSKITFEHGTETLPDTTIANIEVYHSQLKSSWEIGEQVATLEGLPLARTYSLLQFENHAQSMELVDLGYDSSEYEGRYYYRVVHKFYETEYYSSSSPHHINFTKWEQSFNSYLQDIIYKHTINKTIRWERPYTIVPCSPILNSSVSNNSTTNINSDSLYCTPLPLESKSSTSTGRGNPIVKVIPSQSNAGLGVATSIQWDPLTLPYIKTIEVGEALGAIITSDCELIIRLKSTLKEIGVQVTDSPILLTKPYLEIEVIDATEYLPTFINVDFYGVELWRSFNPITIDDEPDIVVHSLDTPQELKYKPPGKSDLPDNFWNSKPNSNPYENYIQRQGVSPTWL